MLLRVLLIVTILIGIGAIAVSQFVVRPHIQTIIDARGFVGAGGIDRLFEVTSSGKLTLQNVTLQGGYTPSNGGAIANHGLLTVQDSTITQSYADEGF